jgi:hypothetical protein
MVKFSKRVSFGTNFIIRNLILPYSNCQHAKAVIIGLSSTKRQSEWSCSSLRTNARADMRREELNWVERNQCVPSLSLGMGRKTNHFYAMSAEYR